MNKKEAGPTGDYPNGKLHKDDKGGLAVAIGIANGVVTMDFGTELSWIGLDAISAITFGEKLIELGNKLKNG